VASTQRELRELLVLLRSPEHDSNNIGVYLGEHAERLAPILRTSPDSLRSALRLTDERVVPELRRRVASVIGDQQAARATKISERSSRAACLLGQTVRWTELGGVLDVDLLLSDVIADRQNKYVAFSREEHPGVAVRRDLLARVAPLKRNVLDLVAFVDHEGVHFRWNGGRGGYNWLPQVVPDHEGLRVLKVSLRAPACPALGQTVPGRGAWLGDVLRDVGLQP
jgi:hypothetical protein